MAGFLRTIELAAALSALLSAAPAFAAKITAPAAAKVVKPLVLNRVQDFDLGTVLISNGAFSGATVRLSRTGVFTCAAPLTCSGARQVAIYNVAGSNNTTVRVTTPDVILVNQSDSTKTLRLTIDSPGTVTFTNSAPRGVDFQLGGSITLDSNVIPGTYQGTFNVTVDY